MNLEQTLEEKMGLYYATGAFVDGSWNNETLVLYGLLKAGDVQLAADKMIQLLTKIHDGGVDAELLEVVKDNARLDLAQSFDTKSRFTKAADNWLLNKEHVGNRLMSMDEMEEAIKNFDQKAVKELAAYLLTRSYHKIVMTEKEA